MKGQSKARRMGLKARVGDEPDQPQKKEGIVAKLHGVVAVKSNLIVR